MKTITTPENVASIAFHESLGMSATTVGGYAGPGLDRVVLWAEIEDGDLCQRVAPHHAR